MTKLKDLSLAQNERDALNSLQNTLVHQFNAEILMLYGSYASGKPDEESDIDLLVVLPESFSREKRHEIAELIFEINLQYDTNISSLVVDRDNWDAGLFSVLSIRQETLETGVPL